MKAAFKSALLAVVLLVPAAQAQPPSEAPAAERPTYAVGDRWIRSDGAYDLVRLEDDQYVFAAGSGREIRLTKDLVLASVRRGTSTWAFEPPAKLEWPLRVGKRGQVPGVWRGPHAPADGIPAQIRWHVEGVEPVTVAGVTLQAYRVFFGAAFEGAAQGAAAQPRAQGRPGGGGGRGGGGGGGQARGLTGVGFKAWYAPETRQWVKAESGAEWARFEVVAFDRMPPALVAKPDRPAPVTGATAGPLTIEVRFPKDNARVTDEASVIVAIVNSGKGVTKVTVTVNGVEVSQENQRGLQRSVPVGTPVTLRPGPNKIVVTATDPDGTLRQETRTVFYDVPQVAAVAPGETAPTPRPVVRNQWAVVIGVGDYENASIPKLRYTVPDAQAIYDTLVGPVGFKKENVLLLTDTTERKPTLKNIKWALGTFLGRSAQKDDTVLIFFAGHGAPEIDIRGIEKDGQTKYLIPRDADPDDLYSTALPMDELSTIFERIEAKRVVAFLDACFSGNREEKSVGRTFASKKTRAGTINDEFVERQIRSKGRAIMTASNPTEVSLELPDLGHGVFTYYLVEGLKGAADTNKDGIVTLQELYTYMQEQVTKKSRSAGGNQHPMMKSELEGDLPLAKVKVSK